MELYVNVWVMSEAMDAEKGEKVDGKIDLKALGTVVEPPKPETVMGRMMTRGRFALALLTLLCLTSIWSNIIAFNFCLVCLASDEESESKPEPTEEVTTHHEYKTIKFSETEKTILTSILAATALVANFITAPLMTRFGARRVFTIAGITSAMATVFLPISMHRSFAATAILRALQGAAFSANFPLIGVFASRWSYYKQNGLAVSSLVAFVQLSPTLSDPISGALCQGNLGWTSILYGHAIVGFVIFLVWGAVYRNTPAKHPFISAYEKYKVTVQKPVASKAEAAEIPYVKILKTRSVWAIWLASIGNFFCVNVIFLFSPNYLNHVLKMNVSSTGASSAVPAILQFLVKVGAGAISDKLHFIPNTHRLRIFNTIAFLGSAGCFIPLAFISGHGSSTLCFILLSAATGFLGCATGGFFKAGPMVARQYSQFVTGNIACGVDITMIIVPFVIGSVAPQNTAEEWKFVFLIIAAILVITNVIFCLMCSAEPAEWTLTKTDLQKGKEISLQLPKAGWMGDKVAPEVADVKHQQF
uniref:MFS domain-containing protein n=1 Tax=Panagrellus redivivus TaxID=6233 RepID=A0A7E5A1A0_PANRE